MGSKVSLTYALWGPNTKLQRHSRQGFWVSMAANTEGDDLSQESQCGTGVGTQAITPLPRISLTLQAQAGLVKALFTL